MKTARKMFFCENKNQKTFVNFIRHCETALGPDSTKFLAPGGAPAFFQKRSAFLLQAFA
jgi:hypothetical protein